MNDHVSTRRIFLQRGLTLLAVTPTIPTFLDQTVLALQRQADGARVQGPSGRDGKILVVVQLSGGNDGLSTLVPYAEDAYHRARGSLAIGPDGVLRLSDYLGLAPQLGGLREMFEQGRLSIVPGVGYPNPNRSHFRSMDIWQSAQPDREVPTSGWLGRYFDNTCSGDDPHAGLSIGEQLPLAMKGERVVPLSFDRPESFRYNGRDRQRFLELNAHEGEGLAPATGPNGGSGSASGADGSGSASGAGRGGSGSSGSASRTGGTGSAIPGLGGSDLGTEGHSEAPPMGGAAGARPPTRPARAGLVIPARRRVEAAFTMQQQLDFLHRTAMDAQVSSDTILRLSRTYEPVGQYPNGELGSGLRTIAAMIAGGLPTRVYYVSQGGFDTHVNQGPRHAQLMAELNNGLSAFWQDMRQQGNQDRVLLMTFSEFGRRVQVNASAGTDHGAAGPMFLIGPQVRAGLAGPHPSLTDLHQGDLRHTVDFRSVYATILQHWLDAPSRPILGGQFPLLGNLFRT